MSLGGSARGPGVEQTDLRERTGATLLSGRPRLSMGCGGEIRMFRAPGPGSEVSSADSRRSPPVPGTDGLTDRPTQGRESRGPVPLILAPGVEAYFSVPAMSWSQSSPSPSEEPAGSEIQRDGPVGLTARSENPRLAGGLSSVPSLPHLPPPRGAGWTHLPHEQCP